MNDEITLAKKQLIEACHRAYKRGIQTGTGGNVSARIKGTDTMIVKSSGSSLGDVDENRGFVITDFDGNVIEGNEKPTREALLHGMIYKIREDANAVMHFHAVYTNAWSINNEILPMISWHSKLKNKSDIPVINIPAAMVRLEDKEIMENVLANKDLNSFILRLHGLVSIGKNPLSAYHAAELIEETAKINVLNKLMR